METAFVLSIGNSIEIPADIPMEIPEFDIIFMNIIMGLPIE